MLPTHLVTGHPQFLRPYAAPRRCATCMHLYSADLARGRWRLEGDGQPRRCARRLGYALENRLVVSQPFPNFGDMRVARLASFFNAYKESILPWRRGATAPCC